MSEGWMRWCIELARWITSLAVAALFAVSFMGVVTPSDPAAVILGWLTGLVFLGVFTMPLWGEL